MPVEKKVTVSFMVRCDARLDPDGKVIARASFEAANEAWAKADYPSTGALLAALGRQCTVQWGPIFTETSQALRRSMIALGWRFAVRWAPSASASWPASSSEADASRLGWVVACPDHHAGL